MGRSAPSHGNDNFQLVAIGKRRIPITASRNDFAIPFDSYSLAGKLQRFEQPDYVRVRCDSAGASIDN